MWNMVNNWIFVYIQRLLAQQNTDQAQSASLVSVKYASWQLTFDKLTVKFSNDIDGKDFNVFATDNRDSNSKPVQKNFSVC